MSLLGLRMSPADMDEQLRQVRFMIGRVVPWVTGWSGGAHAGGRRPGRRGLRGLGRSTVACGRERVSRWLKKGCAVDGVERGFGKEIGRPVGRLLWIDITEKFDALLIPS